MWARGYNNKWFSTRMIKYAPGCFPMYGIKYIVNGKCINLDLGTVSIYITWWKPKNAHRCI